MWMAPWWHFWKNVEGKLFIGKSGKPCHNARNKVESDNDNFDVTFSPHYGLRTNTHSWVIR